MNWLARLKKTEIPAKAEATEPTKPGFVGFVAPMWEHMQKTGADPAAANDADIQVANKTDGKGWARVEPGPNGKVMQRFEKTSDPDRWAWPHSDAMNGGEIDTFTARLTRFTGKGLALGDGEALADKLVTRDRESGDRRLCLECQHLAGHAGPWGCRAWQRAGVAINSRGAGLPDELVRLLQRCDGFTTTH